MKRFTPILAIFILMFALPGKAFAHSHYESSTPGDGEVMQEPVNEISITFDGGIEEGNVEVTGENGETISVRDIEVESPEITATLEEPLENGEYTVSWHQISADTHTVEGDFTFSVDAAEDEGATPEDEAEAESEAATEEQQEEASDEQTGAVETEQTEENESGSAMLWISIIAAIAFIAVLVAYAKKRK
ncbi:copper resistance CopC family protein [Shouchella shacheensis]|uniref:copper resistance CopC family protein n=1 Tax=Shouchella shacheensis TaxID=1649580 RepID=UPI0015D61602|nr:copper resistance protein CopC [Shouchella shacheensis]